MPSGKGRESYIGMEGRKGLRGRSGRCADSSDTLNDEILLCGWLDAESVRVFGWFSLLQSAVTHIHHNLSHDLLLRPGILHQGCVFYTTIPFSRTFILLEPSQRRAWTPLPWLV
jgi:hypothetical protein